MKDFWDQRYSEPGYAYGTAPNAFLAAQRPLLKAGMKALAVADGEGRNGVWLAEQGLDVLSVDASAVGLRKASELANKRGVALRAEQADLASWRWPQAAFDVVAAIYIHFMPELRARMHAAMYAALKPGGVLVLEAFTPDQLEYRTGGPPVVEMLYTADMLREDFGLPRPALGVPASPNVLLLQETLTDLDEGDYHHGIASVVRLVLRKPAR